MAKEGIVQVEFEIYHTSHIYAIREEVLDIAEKIGFNKDGREEIVLVVKELASNLIKHANGGVIAVRELDDIRRRGILIESLDKGPGISDVERAIGDGFSTMGSLGYGLGTANRLMDELEIESGCGHAPGCRIICKKWVREISNNTYLVPLDVGAATQSHPQFKDNGDAFIIKKWDENILVGVIDGLGHGQFAHRASMTAKSYVEKHFDQSLDRIFRGTGRACKPTRGVVMALARFNWAEGKVSFAGIGNIGVRVVSSEMPPRFLSKRGIVKINLSNMPVTDAYWDSSNIMILYSDGIQSHWSWEKFQHLEEKPAATISRELLRKLSRLNDDATVVVVKGQKHE